MPPTLRPAARGRARGVLSLEAIVDEAMRIIDREGIDEVSMRRIAGEFDTGPASLYAHVANKDDLLAHCLRRVVSEVPMPTGETWQELVRSWAFGTHNTFVAHGDIVRLTFGTIAEGPKFVDIMERILGALQAAHVPPRVATWGLDVLSLYVAADAYEGWIMGRIFEDRSGRPTAEVGQEYFQQFAERLAALPAKQYPAMTPNLTSLMSGGGDERFAFGVDTFIAGMAAQVPAEGADRADG
ncbi:putative transcriptional regulator, TetR family [Nostocoides australiense Ben110]|uniref:Putative transcriptional regulator, TetR family n=1 Tax=Nostocoides australiense Ben110 TaxID=1193182 RepID=W6K106_9MICO|nr:TetR/AcrR family transcriptional regulator [Tetrasphaera australiensis]CCH74705.1 putative transcriptional regulator, TetR family [Tetrasphaera australiensis Ben110]